MAGIGYYQFIEKLEKDFEQRKEETVEELCKLMKKILRPENFMISYTGERESLETVQKLAGAVKAGLGTEPVEKSEEKLTCTKKNANEIDAAEKILREIKPKGMIFLGGSVANFQKGFANISVPSVLATLVSDELDFPNLSMVGVDDRAAAYQAVSYLIQQGHRKIAVLGGPATSHPSMMRRQGAQQAMEDAGIRFEDKLYGLSNYDFESAYHAMNGLLARRAEFTALFAMSDVIAFGAIRALVSAGLRVPEDVSVIGFDGITMSRYCVPVMTTIVQPSEQIALQSIELLVRQIEHGTPAQTVTLQPELQQGESVRAL